MKTSFRVVGLSPVLLFGAGASPYHTCSDVPGTVDGNYMLHPPSSNIVVASKENVAVPAGGVSVYCQFEGGRAWALVGTFKDGVSNRRWATDGGSWDYSSRPEPDDTTSGVTDRFPLKFWNDLAQALPSGAIRHTSSVYKTESSGTYDYCPGFWKTSCQLFSAHQALTPQCAEPWQDYSADGTFINQQYNRGSDTGYTDGHGAILGYHLASNLWGGTLILTSFQGGSPALGKCYSGSGSYLTYQHNRGFMLWIGGLKGEGLSSAPTTTPLLIPQGPSTLLMKLKASSNTFQYDASYWTDTSVLNEAGGASVSDSDDEDVKMSAFNTLSISALTMCYKTLTNCYSYDLGATYTSAQSLFSSGFIRSLNLGGGSATADVAKRAFTDLFLPPGTPIWYDDYWTGTGGGICAMQRPGINTQCNDNNWARIGYCVNLPDQHCTPEDGNDADSPVGIGLKTQNWPNNVNAPFGEYFIYGAGNSGVEDFQHQAWLFAGASTVGASTNAPTDVPTNTPTNVPTAAPTDAPTTTAPTEAPSKSPTETPTAAPTNVPTISPTTAAPTNEPTSAPTGGPCEDHTECASGEKCKGGYKLAKKCRQKKKDCKRWGHHSVKRWGCAEGESCTGGEPNAKWGSCVNGG